MNLIYILFLFLSACLILPAPPLDLSKIKLPPDFKIEVYADNIANARSIVISPNGTLFVGTRGDKVYAIKDLNGDHKADKVYTIAKGLNSPNGVAYKDGDLYIGEISRITKITNVESKLDHPGTPEIVFDQYPDEEHHGWKYIAFGPDGKLYIPVGAPCNICEPKEEVFASITRLDVATKKMEIVQKGIRNSVGLAWHPDNKQLWFTDNGRDWLGDDEPSCELNHAEKDGQNFGYPYCHQGDLSDPEFGAKHHCNEFTPPVLRLGAHVAPLGLEFYNGKQFPVSYIKQILVAEHGSWNRKIPQGYRIALINLDKNQQVSSSSIFAEGWLQHGKAWGRPVDLEQMADGSMLVSDDFANVIYRISYSK